VDAPSTALKTPQREARYAIPFLYLGEAYEKKAREKPAVKAYSATRSPIPTPKTATKSQENRKAHKEIDKEKPNYSAMYCLRERALAFEPSTPPANKIHCQKLKPIQQRNPTSAKSRFQPRLTPPTGPKTSSPPKMLVALFLVRNPANAKSGATPNAAWVLHMQHLVIQNVLHYVAAHPAGPSADSKQSDSARDRNTQDCRRRRPAAPRDVRPLQLSRKNTSHSVFSENRHQIVMLSPGEACAGRTRLPA